jgi:hypothetical protein
MPRLRRWRLSLAKKPSTALSQIRDDFLKPTAIGAADVHNNSCSHDESLNCFGRFGNRPNESDH